MSKRIQVILSDAAFDKLLEKIKETGHTASRQAALLIGEGLVVCDHEMIPCYEDGTISTFRSDRPMFSVCRKCGYSL